jgi:CubicO group peptidase (beta-lactamase class C family)
MRLLLLVVSLLAPSADLDGFLHARMADTGAPGLSYAVVEGDRVTRSGAWGTDGAGRPMTTRTPVGFGSVSKSVTALATARLVDAGAVRLDDPVVAHLPWFRLDGPADRITVRHLLEQTSGIPAADGYALADRDDNAPGGIRRWVGELSAVAPSAVPGERHQYGPANAMVLAAMIEEVTGLSYADYLARQVFHPLGMSGGIATEAAARRMPPGHEFYFGAVRGAPWTFDTSGVPYGYAAGSVLDLARLATPFTDPDGDVIAADTVAELQRGGPRVGSGRYGLGWRVSTLEGERIVWHAGAVTGYHSIVIAAPDRGIAVAVQQNVYSPLHDEALNSAGFGAMTLLLGGTPSPVPGTSADLWAVAALGATALGLGVATVFAVRRVLRPRRGRWTPVGWTLLGASVAVGVSLLPGAFDLELRQLLRFLPDVGQLSVVVMVLGGVLAAAGLAAFVRGMRRGETG